MSNTSENMELEYEPSEHAEPLSRMKTLFGYNFPDARGANEDYYVATKYPALGSTGSTEEWDYFSRRTCQEILPGLFLGPFASATRAAKDSMHSLGLTHVVCVRSPEEAQIIRPNHLDSFKYLVVEIRDTLYSCIIPELKTVISFLDDCFKNGGRALVHGNSGLCRSAAMVVGYVMWRHGVDSRTAFGYVQKRRFCVMLNDAFVNQLRDFEMMVKAVHHVPHVPPGHCSNKRSLEEDDELATKEKMLITPDILLCREEDSPPCVGTYNN